MIIPLHKHLHAPTSPPAPQAGPQGQNVCAMRIFSSHGNSAATKKGEKIRHHLLQAVHKASEVYLNCCVFMFQLALPYFYQHRFRTFILSVYMGYSQELDQGRKVFIP